MILLAGLKSHYKIVGFCTQKWAVPKNYGQNECKLHQSTLEGVRIPLQNNITVVWKIFYQLLLCDTLAPYSWPHSVSWCLAEVQTPWPMWLGKDFTLLVKRLGCFATVTPFGSVCSSVQLSCLQTEVLESTCCGLHSVNIYQGSRHILVLKFKDFSRTLKLHFQGPILDRSLQHGQY